MLCNWCAIRCSLPRLWEPTGTAAHVEVVNNKHIVPVPDMLGRTERGMVFKVERVKVRAPFLGRGGSQVVCRCGWTGRMLQSEMVFSMMGMVCLRCRATGN
jgi:hypothetical protein